MVKHTVEILSLSDSHIIIVFYWTALWNPDWIRLNRSAKYGRGLKICDLVSDDLERPWKVISAAANYSMVTSRTQSMLPIQNCIRTIRIAPTTVKTPLKATRRHVASILDELVLISRKWYNIEWHLQWTTNRKSYPDYQIAPLTLTLNAL